MFATAPSAEWSCQHIGSSGSGQVDGLVARRAGSAAVYGVWTKFNDSHFLLRPPGERYEFTGMYDVISPPTVSSLTEPLSLSQAMQIGTTPLITLLLYHMFSFLKSSNFVKNLYPRFMFNDRINNTNQT